jgi:hypothetical protein
MFGAVPIRIHDEFLKPIDLDSVIYKIESIIPDRFVADIESIFVGDYSFLVDKQMNAMFHDNVMYISNNQSSEEDLLDDIVHEIAHAVEFTHFDEIYNNSSIEHEFKRKKMILSDYLEYNGIIVPDFFEDEVKFSQRVDDFLYREVGYDNLNELIIGLFLNPYSITSLREYWAVGFEYFFLQSSQEVKEISPSVYEIITKLLN